MELKKLYNLDIYKNIKVDEMLCKLHEEVNEVEFELVVPTTTESAIASELLDVMQVCMGIAYTQNIDLSKHIDAHNYKLMSRGHKLID